MHGYPTEGQPTFDEVRRRAEDDRNCFQSFLEQALLLIDGVARSSQTSIQEVLDTLSLNQSVLVEN